MAIKLEIKKGDSVKTIIGNNKGKTGEILAVYPKTLKVVVRDCKTAKKATKSGKKNPGRSFVSEKMPVDISNVVKI